MHVDEPFANTLLSFWSANTLLAVQQNEVWLEGQEFGAQLIGAIDGIVDGEPMGELELYRYR